MSRAKAKTVDISPSPGILSVLQHVNYKPWNALAEYIDNSIQSSIDHREELDKLYKGSYRLEINIGINEILNQIEVEDNAAGIEFQDFPRAFRTAKVPDNREGLSEFGMGMKCASCWFGKNWQVRTKFLKDNIERVVDFDVDEIVQNEQSMLPCQERIVGNKKPYTVISISNIQKIPKGRTVNKIRSYLADIYRSFIRDGLLEIKLNGEALKYHTSDILIAPYLNEGPEKEWKVDLDFKLNDGQLVKGFAAILKKGSRSKSGFALFRRGRVIQGSGEDGYRPPEIFGTQSSFRFLRIFGEIHLDQLGVSHTKDGFKWEEAEEEFIDKLHQALKDKGQFLKQADGYRVSDITAGNKHLGASISHAVNDLSEDPVRETLAAAERLDEQADDEQEEAYDAYRNHVVDFRGIKWKVSMQFNKNLGSDDWIKVKDKPSATSGNYKELEIDIALNHKIMLEHGTASKKALGLLIKFAISVGIAAYTAKLSPGQGSFVFIKAFNELASQYIAKQNHD